MNICRASARLFWGTWWLAPFTSTNLTLEKNWVKPECWPFVNQGVLPLINTVLGFGLLQVQFLEVFDGVYVGHHTIPVPAVHHNLISGAVLVEQIAVAVDRPSQGYVVVVGYVLSTWTVPLHALEFGVEGLFVDVEVGMDAVEVGAERVVVLQSLRKLNGLGL